MKKIMSFIFALGLIFCLGALAGCSKITASASGFEFTYEKNSALKTTISNQDYITLKLEVKNTESKENQVDASLFTLKQGEEDIESQVIFGNNIVDQMDSETLDAKATVSLILNILPQSEITGKYQLFYNNTKLIDFNILNN